jgi:hypothetical protein
MKSWTKIVIAIAGFFIVVGIVIVTWAVVTLYQLTQTVDTFISMWVATQSTNEPAVIIPELSVPERITIVAVNMDYRNAETLIALAKCESNLDPEIVSSNGLWRGLYQADRNFIPYGTCAFDVECSTQKTIEALNRGESWRWPACWKVIHS